MCWRWQQILLVLYVVARAAAARASRRRAGAVLEDRFDAQLLRLNFGIFTLHLAQMAMFVVIPLALVNVAGLPLAEHWKVYCQPCCFRSC